MRAAAIPTTGPFKAVTNILEWDKKACVLLRLFATVSLRPCRQTSTPGGVLRLMETSAPLDKRVRKCRILLGVQDHSRAEETPFANE